MFTVADPVCVRTPPASKARIVKVRAEPAGSVTVPKATPPTTGMLNTSGGTMSAAVTSTTTVATDVPDTSARTSNMVSTGPGRAPVGSRGRHEPSARTEASVAAIRTRSTALRRDAHRRGPSNPLERGRDRRVARTPRRHRSEEHTSELQSLAYLVCRLLLEKKKKLKLEMHEDAQLDAIQQDLRQSS